MPLLYSRFFVFQNIDGFDPNMAGGRPSPSNKGFDFADDSPGMDDVGTTAAAYPNANYRPGYETLYIYIYIG